MATKKRAAARSGSIFPHKRRNAETGELEQVGWCAMLELGRVDGKRRRKTFYGKS